MYTLSVMMRKGMAVVVVFGQFPEIAVDVVRVAAFGFQLNRHMFDAEVGRESIFDER